MEHRLRLPRLRSRRPPRSPRCQLHRSRSGDRADPVIRAVPLQGASGRVRAARPDRRTQRRSTTTVATAPSRTCPRHQGSRVRTAPTASVSARSTSTTTAGSTSTSPTIPIPARSTATITTARSPTSACRPAAPTARMASRRPAWAWRSATTIATARWTSSRPTLPGTRRRSTRTPARDCAKTGRSPAGLGTNTRWLGWGTAFVDLDNDGWLDLFLANGHVYPEVRQLKTEAGYEQRKVVYRNLGNGRFADITERLGRAGRPSPKAARGAAFGDIDNDGQVDVAIANVNDVPDLYQAERRPQPSLDDAHARRRASRTVTRLARACARSRARRSSGRRCAAGAATCRRTISASISASVPPLVSIASRCAGRTDSSRAGTDLTVDQFHTLKEGTGRAE